MLKFLKSKFSKKNEHKNFFDLPARSKKRIIAAAVRQSNEMQLEVVKEYERRYGHGVTIGR